jgi:acetyl-CoA C-acetyltransferase
MKDSDIVVIGQARTPLGGFGGTLREIQAYDLGAVAIKAALERAGIKGSDLDQVILGNCRQAGNGPNPARTASVRGGVPIPVPALTINMACPSGMKAMMMAAQELAAGSASFILAGGMESMSTMPYLLKNARWQGFKFGDKVLSDSWSDTVDPLCGYGMGMTAENQADKYGITRDEQDSYALNSHQKAAKAQAEGWLEGEITPVRLLPTRKNPEGEVFADDEAIRQETSMKALAGLKPVFKEGGTVTPGNACSMGDGACAAVLTTRAKAKSLGMSPLYSIVSFAQGATEPSVMGDGPGISIPMALKKAGLSLADMDLIEVNEAFAAQILSNGRTLKWDQDKVNVHGGAIALSHPTGMSGCRIVITLANALRRRNKELGVAAICGGGGVTTAMVIRRES